MVVDSFIDMDGGRLWLRAWRCVNRREVVEPDITPRRLAQRSRFVRLLERLTKRASKAYEVVPLSV